ncbi:hypothetical protein ACFL1M_01560 [Patescibacteria group bacterium]
MNQTENNYNQNSSQEPFVQGVEISVKKIKFKKYLNRAIFILLTIQGARGLYSTVRDILVVYPKIALYYKELEFDQSIYTQIIQKSVLVGATSFIEILVGLGNTFKRSGSIKTVHTVAGFLILLISLYLKREGALPDFDAIEKVAFFISK